MRGSNESVEHRRKSNIVLAGFPIDFQRTVRVPEGQINSLPAGLGSFPIYKVGDFQSGCPEGWKPQGYFMPMYAQEAMWMNFPQRSHFGNPHAVLVAAGNINAVTGKQIPYKKTEEGETLDIVLQKEQNYLVVPPQPWLDGWKAPDDKIYQFVAAELGSGETVEGQITGKEEIGGIQIALYEPKEGAKLTIKSRPYEYIVSGAWPMKSSEFGVLGAALYCCSGESLKGLSAERSVRSMGLGRGGEIRQKIYDDPHGLEVWKAAPKAKTIVYLVSSEDFRQITGVNPPPTPVTMESYQEIGLPWFKLPDGDYVDTPGSDIFEKLKPVGTGKAKVSE